MGQLPHLHLPPTLTPTPTLTLTLTLALTGHAAPVARRLGRAERATARRRPIPNPNLS